MVQNNNNQTNIIGLCSFKLSNSTTFRSAGGATCHPAPQCVCVDTDTYLGEVAYCRVVHTTTSSSLRKVSLPVNERKKESLFYLTMPLERIDFHIIGY